MNLILLEPDDFTASGLVCLRDRRLTHIRTVLRVSAGDTLQVGMIGGQLGCGTVVEIGQEHVELSVVLNEDPPPPTEITLLLALPRPKALKRVLQSVACMGVKRIYLVNSWRVEKSYWQSPLLQAKAMHQQLLLGLEQGRDTLVPSIHLRRFFKPFVEDELPSLIEGRVALLANPNAVTPCPFDVCDPVLLAIGPEGGFIPYEIEMLSATGLSGVRLGHRAMRVETAVPALLGRLLCN